MSVACVGRIAVVVVVLVKTETVATPHSEYITSCISEKVLFIFPFAECVFLIVFRWTVWKSKSGIYLNLFSVEWIKFHRTCAFAIDYRNESQDTTHRRQRLETKTEQSIELKEVRIAFNFEIYFSFLFIYDLVWCLTWLLITAAHITDGRHTCRSFAVRATIRMCVSRCELKIELILFLKYIQRVRVYHSMRGEWRRAANVPWRTKIEKFECKIHTYDDSMIIMWQRQRQRM